MTRGNSSVTTRKLFRTKGRTPTTNTIQGHTGELVVQQCSSTELWAETGKSVKDRAVITERFLLSDVHPFCAWQKCCAVLAYIQSVRTFALR